MLKQFILDRLLNGGILAGLAFVLLVLPQMLNGSL